MPPKVATVWIYSREIIWPHKRFGPKYGANNFSKLELEYCSFSCLPTWRIHPRLTSTMGSNPLWSGISNSINTTFPNPMRILDYTQKNKSHYLLKVYLVFTKTISSIESILSYFLAAVCRGSLYRYNLSVVVIYLFVVFNLVLHVI